jgi:beta-glucosidase
VLYTVSTTVHNTGSVRGSAVPQLYISFPDSTPAGTPPKQLRGFEKIELAAGQRGEVKFDLMRRDLSYWNVEEQTWVIPEGEFELRVGWSSRDLVLGVGLAVVSRLE